MDFEAYVRELADPQQSLAIAKLSNLSRIGPEEVALFKDAWTEMELSRRLRLSRELTELAEDDIELNFDAVFLLALADRDAGIQQQALRGLWEYEGRDLLDPLLALLAGDADAAVRAEAALSLGRFVLMAEFDMLAASDSDRVEQALRAAVENTSEVAEVRGRALEAIGARSAPWVRELIAAAFDGPDRRLRLSAVHAMGRNCDASWLPTLRSELKSDDAEMRFEAAVACGAIADEGAVTPLVGLLDDEDGEVREAAAGALGEIGGDEAKEALQSLIDGDVDDGDDEPLRDAARAALAELEFADEPLGIKLED